jgi:hypothetical protein
MRVGLLVSAPDLELSTPGHGKPHWAKLGAVFSPSPRPLPTVTVTQTLPPATPPTVYVKVPDGWDPLTNVWLSDFGGALLGALVGLGVAMLVVSAERKARLEERRTSFAAQFLDVLAKLHWEVQYGDRALIQDALGTFAQWAPRMVGLYGNTREHRQYALWLQAETVSLILKVRAAMQEVDTPGGITQELATELSKTLSVLQGSTIKWIMLKPRHWQPDLQARYLPPPRAR